MRRFSKQNLAMLASMTLALSQSTAGSAKLLGLPGLPKKAKPQVTQPAEGKTTAKVNAEQKKPIEAKTQPAASAPIVSERLKAAAQNLLAARKQVDIARAQLKAAEAEYKVAKIEREAIALRQAALGMAKDTTTQNLAKQNIAASTRIEAAPTSALPDLLPEPAISKPAMAPVPGWNKQSAEETSIDDLDLP